MTVLRSIDFFSSSSASVAIEVRAPQSTFPEHHHDFYEIIIVEQGAGVHVFNGAPYTLSSGCVCFVRDHDRHLFESTDALFLTNVLFRAPDAFRFLSGVEHFLPRENDGIYPSHWRVNGQVLQQVKQLISCLECSPHSERAEDIALNESVFMQLLVQLWQGCLAQTGDDQEGRLCQLLDWLQNNYSEAIEWSALADRFALPLRTLHRQLKNQTGMTPQRYLTRLRLLQARRQLCYSDSSVTDIAYQCGFGDSNHFSTLFKREFSQSPRDLRSQL
ncbi:HTH-type transcriptional activator RhaS [Yersinia aldovae]|uniref:HTH-type transcriptional activator RhaS n=1 Tax=Yersinia aldovae TaxID=29483 RepID=A0A0T9TY11_YERAL|nr:HTH-type transcriptional activator RhaS [Yersinia aldovae]EEP95823.1 HTH-type transcriptional activator rhaS [Yersinia aldovae ATCC 35236]CNJ14417.1 transcriptional activator RhaS [Yersinia aldovae]CNL08140.1 transcriptional activator RhaS [Yersinia aldovae]